MFVLAFTHELLLSVASLNMGIEDKVAKVDYSYASSHYESGSKHPAQPIWRLAGSDNARSY